MLLELLLLLFEDEDFGAFVDLDDEGLFVLFEAEGLFVLFELFNVF